MTAVLGSSLALAVLAIFILISIEGKLEDIREVLERENFLD